MTPQTCATLTLPSSMKDDGSVTVIVIHEWSATDRMGRVCLKISHILIDR
jgi:hypothetical protein